MIEILVLHRGWVVVGRTESDGFVRRVVNGAVIRRWGTTKGLGELAESGPLRETVLDPIRNLRVHEIGIVLSLECDAAKWRLYK